jgi:sugar lactone lactonase YvrE
MFGGIQLQRDLLCVGSSDSCGRVLVMDLRHRVVRASWSFRGPDGEFADVGGLCLLPDGHLLVADTLNHLVRRFTLFGQEVGRIGVELPAAERPVFRDERGYLLKPNAVAVDAAGHIFVACGDRALIHGVQRFGAQGERPRSLRAFGEPGERFGAPQGLTVGDGKLFIADTYNGCVQVFRTEGRFLGMFSTATRPGERSQPTAVAVLPGGRLAVAQWREPAGIKLFDRSGSLVGEVVREGREPGQVQEPTDLAVDARGRLFVLDRDGERVQCFDAHGRFLEQVLDLRQVPLHG